MIKKVIEQGQVAGTTLTIHITEGRIELRSKEAIFGCCNLTARDGSERVDVRSKHNVDVSLIDDYTVTAYYKQGGTWKIGFRALVGAEHLFEHWTRYAERLDITMVRLWKIGGVSRELSNKTWKLSDVEPE